MVIQRVHFNKAQQDHKMQYEAAADTWIALGKGIVEDEQGDILGAFIPTPSMEGHTSAFFALTDGWNRMTFPLGCCV